MFGRVRMRGADDLSAQHRAIRKVTRIFGLTLNNCAAINRNMIHVLLDYIFEHGRVCALVASETNVFENFFPTMSKV